MRLAITAKNEVTGQTVNFKVYDRDGNMLYDLTGTEWVDGRYYIDVELTFAVDQAPYLVVAREQSNAWVVSKSIVNPQSIDDQNFIVVGSDVKLISIPIFDTDINGDMRPGFGFTDPHYEIINDQIVPKEA